jgi:hypothetical protein
MNRKCRQESMQSYCVTACSLSAKLKCVQQDPATAMFIIKQPAPLPLQRSIVIHPNPTSVEPRQLPSKSQPITVESNFLICNLTFPSATRIGSSTDISNCRISDDSQSVRHNVPVLNSSY